MRALAEGHHPVPSGVERGQLEGILIGFRPGVVEEETVVGISRCLPQAVGKFLLQRIAYAVGIEADTLQLRAQRLDIVGMAVAHRNHGVATVEVQIFLSPVVPDLAETAAYGRHVEK